MEHLAEKVSVITGAASGIGAALAHCLDAQGMHLVLVDIHEDALLEVKRRLSREALTFAVDVADEASMQALAAVVYGHYGNVHLLINNAGVMGPMAPLWSQTPDDWQRIFGVNVMGVANGISAFVPHMLEQQDAAHIVNTASEASFAARAFVGVYHASKHAVLAISETLAQELDFLQANIRVSVLCPGAVNTRVMQGVAGRSTPGAAGNEDTGGREAHERPAGKESQEGSRLERIYHRSLERGKTPDEVAATVVDGIKANRFYLLPHPEVAVLAQQRADAVTNDVYPTLDPGLARLLRIDGESSS